MIESGHSLPDLRDVEEYHDDRKIEKIYRRFRFLNNPVSFWNAVKVDDHE